MAWEFNFVLLLIIFHFNVASSSTLLHTVPLTTHYNLRTEAPLLNLSRIPSAEDQIYVRWVSEVRSICGGFNACWLDISVKKQTKPLSLFPPCPLVLLCSFRKASLWCVTSSSCAGLRIAMCPTPRKLSSVFWLKFTTGRGSVGRDAPSSTVCESTYHTPTLCIRVFNGQHGR